MKTGTIIFKNLQRSCSSTTHRWEMKEAADLEDEEKVMVEHLKNVYLTQSTPTSEDKEE